MFCHLYNLTIYLKNKVKVGVFIKMLVFRELYSSYGGTRKNPMQYSVMNFAQILI